MQKTIVKIEKNHNRLLTNRQKTFAELYVEGIYTNKECAIRSGYHENSAYVHASKLLNVKKYPHVVEYIEELRQLRERKYGVTLGGLTTDRRENVHTLDNLTREEIVSRLADLQKQYPQVFIEGDFKKVTDDNRKEPLAKS